MRFEFATVSRIIFGPGTLKEIGGFAAQYGKSALVVTGSKPKRAALLLEILKAQNIRSTIYSASGEPSVEVAKEATRQAREAGCDFVIAFGGGAVIDTGKAVSALLTNPDNISLAGMYAKWFGPGPMADRLTVVTSLLLLGIGAGVVARRRSSPFCIATYPQANATTNGIRSVRAAPVSSLVPVRPYSPRSNPLA